MAKRKNKKRKKTGSGNRQVQSQVSLQSGAPSQRARPRFTVAMATFNRAAWVADAIASVLDQSFTDFEYVIVDDGSTDDTPSIIRAIEDPRINYIYKTVNEGRPATRNRIVAESSGDYILWMADDDRLAPGILARYDVVLQNDPSIDVIYGNLAVFSQSAGSVESTYEPTDWSTNPQSFVGAKLTGSMLPDPGTATRLEVVQSLDYVYDLEFLRAQDYELWTRIAHTIKIHKVDESVYFYRQHDDSASFGDFVDTTFESKIIRAHRARHAGEVLAPDLDWRHRELAQARLNLRIAISLNQYRDGVNALRFCHAIPQWEYEPMVLREAITALCIQGKTQHALALISKARLSVPKLNDVLSALELNISKLTEFQLMTKQQLTHSVDASCIESIQKAYDIWGWTYDLVRVFGHIKAVSGALKDAALAYAYAGRLNLDETECAEALETLAPSVSLAPGKLDLLAMRRRVSESFVDLNTAKNEAEVNSSAVLTILDFSGSSPQPICEILKFQDTDRIELVGFYDSDGGYPWVKAIRRPLSFQAQLERLFESVSGDWFVFAEPTMHLYPSWASSILSFSETGEGVVQWLSVHEDSTEDAEGLMSLKPMVEVGSVYGGSPQPIHRFAFSKTLSNAPDFWAVSPVVKDFNGFRLYASAAALSAQKHYNHVGATAHVSGRLPEVPASVLPDFYRKYQRKTLFHRDVRASQNASLASSKLHFLETGRVTIAHFISNEVAPVIEALNVLQTQTFVPFKSMVFGNLPSDSMRQALRTFRDEHTDLTAVLNSNEVVGPKLLNQALCRIGSDVMVLIDPSIVLPKQWLAQILWTLQERPQTGLFCLTTPQSDTFDLRCCVITKAVLQSVGGFMLDATLQDSVNDFLFRVTEAGFVVEGISDWSVAFRPTDGTTLLASLVQSVARTHQKRTDLFVACAAEAGYQPEVAPVQIAEEIAATVLAYPDWTDLESMGAWLASLTVGDKWTVLLRCPMGEGPKHVAVLTELLDDTNQRHEQIRFQIVDAMLAPEREAGLMVAADAVYIDRSWKDASVWIRRSLECGCRLMTDVAALNTFLNA